MTRIDRENDRRDELSEPLANAVAAVRDEPIDPERLRQAADRVWARLDAEGEAASTSQSIPEAAAAAAAGPIAGCAGVQALLPAYLAGELTAARALLVEDHVRECVRCRRALAAARAGGGEERLAAAVPAAAARTGRAPLNRWLPLAAVLALAVGLVAYLAAGYFLAGGEPATVAAVDGALLSIGGRVGPETGETALAVGDLVAPGRVVRTAKGSSAVVRLADGSAIELDERTQVSFADRRGGTTVRLARGNIIVEAAHQRGSRRLNVATDDCRVAVVGTIFAVDHGVKGSRVSVLEGEVRVAQGGRGERVLRPGEQLTTRVALAAVPVAEEFAWSRNVGRYTELLREVAALRRAIRERVAEPGLRYSSRLLDAVPVGAVAYFALPNLSGQLADSYQVLQERLASSPLLAQWWQEQVEAGGVRPHLDQMVGRLHDFGGYLGDEVAVTIVRRSETAEAAGDHGALILAEVVRPGLRAYLEQEAARINAEAAHAALVLVDDPAAVTAPEDALLLWAGDDLFAAATDPAVLAAGVAAAAGAGPGFLGSGLHARVSAAYDDGAQWLFAGDLGMLLAEAGPAPEEWDELDRLGLADLQYLVVEHRGEGERAVTTAELSLGEPRRGVASWLAAPGPMGALEFVSPEAAMAAAFVVKSPVEMIDDVTADAPERVRELAEWEAATGIDLRADLAAALGGEAAFALDGPLAPEPAWKLIVEVYDPGRLQATIERAVALANEEAFREGRAGATLESSQSAGRTFYRLSWPQGEVVYVFADGYLVAAPSQALLERTLAARAAGTTLPASADFRRLLPADAHTGFSALFYQHLAPLLAPLAGEIGRLAGEGLTPEQSQALSELAGEGGPTLAYAYAEADRIRFAGTSPFNPFSLGGLGGPGFLGLGALLQLSDELEAR